jgi:ferritin
MNLLSENFSSAICEQLVLEKYAANLYLSFAGYLKNLGLDNLALKFEEQHEEETKHSKMMYDFLTDMNAPITIREVPAVTVSPDGIIQLAKLYLDQEIKITKDLGELRNLAMEESAFVGEEFFREMIRLQRNELEEATTFLDKATLTGGDMKTVLLWDASLS